MRNNRKTYDGGQVPQFNNVVNLFDPARPIDPMLDENLLECCRDFFSRGEMTVDGSRTGSQLRLSEQDAMEYGLHAPILITRAPQTMSAFDEIYVRSMTDGRYARIMQIVFCAHINRKPLSRAFLLSLVGHEKCLTQITGATTNQVVESMIENDLCIEIDGEIKCTRRTAYFIIESIGFLLDRMRGFSKTHFTKLSKNWNAADGSTCWTDINSSLEQCV